MSSEKELQNLHSTVTEYLVEAIKSGKASSGDIKSAIEFLKNNGITGIPVKSSPLGELASSMPFFQDDEDLYVDNQVVNL